MFVIVIDDVYQYFVLLLLELCMSVIDSFICSVFYFYCFKINSSFSSLSCNMSERKRKKKRAKPQPLTTAPIKRPKHEGGKKKRRGDGKRKQNSMFANVVESQAVVAKYHVLMKKKEQLLADKSLDQEAKLLKLKSLEREIQKMGGIEKYQQASMFGASTDENAAFNASKWVTKELKGAQGLKKKLRVLDVGAIDDQYKNEKHWLNVTSIDINPQSKSVLKYDFFD